MWITRGFGRKTKTVHIPVTAALHSPHTVFVQQDPVDKRVFEVIHREMISQKQQQPLKI